MIRKRRLFVSHLCLFFFFKHEVGELGQQPVKATSPNNADTDNRDCCMMILVVHSLDITHLNKDILYSFLRVVVHRHVLRVQPVYLLWPPFLFPDITFLTLKDVLTIIFMKLNILKVAVLALAIFIVLFCQVNTNFCWFFGGFFLHTLSDLVHSHAYIKVNANLLNAVQ